MTTRPIRLAALLPAARLPAATLPAATLPAGLLLAGCSSDLPADGFGQLGEEDDLVCVEVDAEALLDTDTVVLDADGAEVAVADVLALATGSYAATLTWQATGEETTITQVSEAEASTAWLVVQEPASDEIPPDNCPERIRFALSGTVSTDDGRLDERLSTLVLSDGDNVFVDACLDGLIGTLDPVAPAVGSDAVEAAQVDLHALVQDSAAPFQGRVAPVLVEDPGADVSALGTWPGEIEEE